MNNNDRISIFSFYLGVFCILWYMCSISTLLLAWITMAGFPSSAPLGCVLHFMVHVFHFNTTACMNNNGRISIFSSFGDVFCILWYMCSISTLLLAWTTMAGFPSSASVRIWLDFVVHVFHFNTAPCMNNNGRISIFSFFWDMIALCGTCVPFQHHCLQLSLWSITHMLVDVEAFLRFFSWLGSVPCLCHFYPFSAQASKTYSPVSSS